MALVSMQKRKTVAKETDRARLKIRKPATKARSKSSEPSPAKRVSKSQAPRAKQNPGGSSKSPHTPVQESQEFQQLLERGRSRHYITYDEINDFLPEDFIQVEQLEDVIALLVEANIDVVRNQQETDFSPVESLQSGEDEDEDEEAPETDAEASEDEFDRKDDPV
ncbi:MAG: RNA polymerase sigma factor region1.1 domain-containing protein, partial [Myxococcota bacterium]